MLSFIIVMLIVGAIAGYLGPLPGARAETRCHVVKARSPWASSARSSVASSATSCSTRTSARGDAAGPRASSAPSSAPWSPCCSTTPAPAGPYRPPHLTHRHQIGARPRPSWPGARVASGLVGGGVGRARAAVGATGHGGRGVAQCTGRHGQSGRRAGDTSGRTDHAAGEGVGSCRPWTRCPVVPGAPAGPVAGRRTAVVSSGPGGSGTSPRRSATP